MEKERTCKVTNRSSGIVAYTLPEKHIVREFYLNETKILPYSELVELAARPGGRALIYNYLYLEDVGDYKDLTNMPPEVEYYMKEEDIDNWLQTCSLAEFQDALDFAPNGVKDLIKSHAVKLPLNDLQKAKAMEKQLHFNVLNAIRNEQEAVADEIEAPAPSKRRVEPETAETGGRRITPKYNVVKKGEAKEE